ncbi:MAG: filamentous hemagglutinin N-terminal domain-containing protein [Xenococcaceae cyanobacterium MO_207.B15]|nr:filamentous hemagglutinin N-terminal domain-containing protein [Xenococcaceae cyanobacterium MO_207.B15]
MISSASAQITTDGSTNTTLTPTDNGIRIDDGDQRSCCLRHRAGGNLFHSFREFSVPNGSEAFFNNASDIVNIFSRVTGGNISNIDGLIRANGGANLFLINPAGILFGEGARLDIGGSFYGSTADSILFSDSEFSATNIQKPILTINAPIGLGDIRGDSGDIVNRSTSDGVGLQVPTGENISLIGREVSFDGGFATAPQGTISLLGNTVVLFDNAKIDVSSDIGGGQVFIGGNFQGRNSLINATRTYIDSDVTINADALSNGHGGRVIVWADEVTGFYGNISARGGSISGNGGFVEVSGKEHLLFRGNVDTSAVNGFPGTLLLDPTNIVIANGSGDEAGDGTDTFAGNNSGVAGSILSTPLNEINDTAPTTIYESELEGLSGNTNIVLEATNNITVEDLADNELTFQSGSGIIAFTADADRNGVGDFVMEDNIRTNGRNIAISGANLTVGNINTSISFDDAGDTIQTASVVSTGSGVNVESISGTLFEAGDADLYQIFLTGNGTFSASTVEGANFDTQLFLFDANGFGIYANDDQVAGVEQQSILPANNPLTPVNPGIYYLAVTAFGNNPVSEGGLIFPTSTFNEANSETIAIAEGVNPPTGVAGNLPLIGFENNLFSENGSYTVNLTGLEGAEATFTEAPIPQITGDSGSITLNATNGNIRTGNLISSNSFGRGGDVTINSGGNIELNGGINTFVTVSTFNSSFAIGPSLDSFEIKGGTVTINAVEDIKISNEIDSSATASIFLNDIENLVVSAEGGSIDVSAGGDIEASVDSSANIFVRNEAIELPVTLKTQGGNVVFSAGGNIGNNNLSTRVNSSTSIGFSSELIDSIVFDNRDLENLINVQSQGGKIELFALGTITGGSFVSRTGSDLGSFVSPTGNQGGDITLNAQEAVLIFPDEFFNEITSGGVGGEGGNITIKGKSISLTSTNIGGNFTARTGNVFFLADDSISLTNTFISNNTGLFPDGIGGEIVLEASSISVSSSQISAFSEGISGQITIKALNDLSFSESSVFTSSQTNQVRDIKISAKNLSLLDGSRLNSNTSSGIGGNIFIETDSLTLSGQNEFGQGSSLSVETFGTGNAGTINLNTSQLIVEDGGRIAASTSGQGNGGNITINASNFSLTDGGQIISNTSGEGNGGNITINATESVTVDGTNPGFIVNSNNIVIFDPSNISTSDPINISTSVEATSTGNGGEINITTPNLSLTNGGQINAISSGQGNGGDIFIQADSLTLDNSSISAANNPSISSPTTETLRIGGNINLKIKDNLILDNESTISAQASENANGGNINIDSKFILAFPSVGDGNDIIANAEQGQGGNINITAEGLLGIAERQAIEGNKTNDIDASSEFGLSGNVTFNVPDTNNFQETAELSSDVVSAESVAEDACAAGAGTSGLILKGKGGVPPAPNLPLSSTILLDNGKPITPNFSQLNNQEQTTQNNRFQVQPIKTSQGDIYPARGVIVREDGTVTLTSYPTDNIATRTPEDAANCHQIQ